MYYDRPTELPCFPIKSNQQFLILGFAAILSAATLSPNRASAFWPFSTNASAMINVSVSGAKTPALIAATNSDPNPDKGLGATIQTSGGRALLAYIGPSGTIADVAKLSSPDRISVYVVRSGDTLSDIAGMFNVSVNTIIWANNLKGTNDMRPGDTLVILPVSGVERTIVKGDTFKSLAKKYDADALEIAQFNGLDLEDPLVVGSTLIIPGGEIATPAPVAPSPSSPVLQSGGGVFVTGYFSNPVPGARVTQGIHGKNGVDLGGARGTPIHAAADGTVIIARGGGAWNGGYGNYVVISHSNGTQTLYSHLRSVIATVGQPVASGQVVGYMGATGRATGVHLHFEVRGAANPFRNCALRSICEPQ